MKLVRSEVMAQKQMGSLAKIRGEPDSAIFRGADIRGELDSAIFRGANMRGELESAVFTNQIRWGLDRCQCFVALATFTAETRPR